MTHTGYIKAVMMNQHKRTNQQTGEPQRKIKAVIEWIATVILFSLLTIFSVWLISATPV